mmetsp:Transcript_629/g.808  ORF Transcript_629/g.808 Transcript_629/m.808 type:complete len:98 (-) Transcript_629:2675-2968(-)
MKVSSFIPGVIAAIVCVNQCQALEQATSNSTEKCSANPICANQGLTGACCPNANNTMLDCCNQKQPECSAHPKCSDLGLTGNCCPSKDGAMLDCCSA